METRLQTMKSIARTTNTLSRTASDNTTLEVVQKDDGTAKVVWSDNADSKDATKWGSTTYDDLDRFTDWM